MERSGKWVKFEFFIGILVLIGLGICLFETRLYDSRAVLFPRIVGGGGFLAIAWHTGGLWRSVKPPRLKEVKVEWQAKSEMFRWWLLVLSAVGCYLITLAVGLALATLIYVPVMALVLGYKKLAPLVVVTCLASLLLMVAMRWYLLPVPRGILFG